MNVSYVKCAGLFFSSKDRADVLLDIHFIILCNLLLTKLNIQKKNKIKSFGTTWMDVKYIMLNEISQGVKDR